MEGSSLRAGIERISDELCKTIGGNFDFNVSLGLHEESLEKLSMLVNFMLDTSRRTLHELSERNAQLAEMDRLRSEFFANVSHELRTPLTLILAPVQSLLERQGNARPERERAPLVTIHNNAVRLLQLVNGLLDFSKLEAGRFEPRREPLDVEELTLALFKEFWPLLAERQIKPSFQAAVDHPVVLLDRYLYERILFNLLSNAAKFTPGGGEVGVALEVEAGRVRVSVSDTGIGISDDDMKQLFHKFRQLEGSSTRRFEGTGLGLAMVKEFAELLGGSVQVESQLGKGSVFRVELSAASTASEPSMPLRSNDALVPRPMPSDPRESAQDAVQEREPGTARILIAEDNPELAAFILSQLVEDFDVRVAEDGEKALQLAREWKPHLILSDVMMPKRDGLSLCRAVRNDEALSEVRVVLLTALTHRDAMLKGWEAGADDYLFKPFNPQELKARVRSIVRLAEARRFVQDHRLALVREQGARAEVEAANAELRRSNRAKDEFLASISHELRTPMNVIVGWTEMLARHAIDPEEHQRIFEVLNRNAKAQAKLVEDLLDIARITTRKLSLNVKPIKLTEIVEQAVGSMRLAAESKRIRIRTVLESPIGQTEGDPDRLQQVFWNLLSNAIKFTPEGGSVEIVLGIEGNRQMVLVRDTGQGIDREFLPQVFERFVQEEGGPARRFGGLGLGLSIARHIIELHGGSIEAESQGRDRGATFRIELPIVTGAEMGNAGTGSPVKLPASDRQALSGIRVMVVDDEADARDLVARLLRGYGAEVVEAASAGEAFSQLQRQLPAILLSDISMPGEDGCALIRRIRALEGNTGRHIPAIALTAHASESERERTLAAGFELHVAKPVLPEQLVELVAKLATQFASGSGARA